MVLVLTLGQQVLHAGRVPALPFAGSAVAMRSPYFVGTADHYPARYEFSWALREKRIYLQPANWSAAIAMRATTSTAFFSRYSSDSSEGSELLASEQYYFVFLNFGTFKAVEELRLRQLHKLLPWSYSIRIRPHTVQITTRGSRAKSQANKLVLVPRSTGTFRLQWRKNRQCASHQLSSPSC